MSKTIVLKENNEIIRKKILIAGIAVCKCAWFTNVCWLDYHVGISDNVHGIGYYGGDIETKSVKEELSRFVYEHPDAIYCKDVDEFIAKIKEYEENA